MKASTVSAFSGQAQQLKQQAQCVRVAAPPGARRCRLTAAAVRCQQQPEQQQPRQQPLLARRIVLALPAGLMAAAGLGAALVAPPAASAFVMPPPGYRYHEDKLDGYSFFYPEDWQPVTVSTACAFRPQTLLAVQHAWLSPAALPDPLPTPLRRRRRRATTCSSATPSAWTRT